MPGSVRVRIIAARDLPIMDRSSELTDAFVELRLGETYQRTKVCPKTLNPEWNSPWFIFPVTEEDLQDEPLQIKLLDHDLYTAHDAIGKVYIRLASLTEATNSLKGWFPIFDTLHGIRGEVHLEVRVEILRDQHKLPSFGVQFFACPNVPSGFTLIAIHGFLEELVVNDDPEYQWIDKIRTPRASNEARQRLFSKLSGELQRKVGHKALEVGANAVIGYRQCFDLEGESGIVVRGIGTCVHLEPKDGTTNLQLPPTVLMDDTQYGDHDHEAPSLAKNLVGEPSGSSSVGSSHSATLKLLTSSEFPFLTLTRVPNWSLASLGGLVSAHSVKLLDKINNPDEPDTRDAWWLELRNEIRQHCRALSCNAVIGYSEATSICDNLCVFSACGTAVKLSPQSMAYPVTTRGGQNTETCSLCHAPYTSLPFKGSLTYCNSCSGQVVPSVLLATCEVPHELSTRGYPSLIQASAVFPKKKLKGDDNAHQVGQALPFLEHKLHEQLLAKLRLRGMNAVFRYKLLLSVGDSLIMGTAVGTGVYLEALPSPPRLLLSGEGLETGKRDEYQSRLSSAHTHYTRLFEVEQTRTVADQSCVMIEPSEAMNDKETVVLPLESEVKTELLVELLGDQPTPPGFVLCTTAELPDCQTTLSDSHMVTMVMKTVSEGHRQRVSKLFSRLLQSLMFKVRHMTPCALTNITYDIDLPEDNELQVAVTAVASKIQTKALRKAQSDELMFNMDTSACTDHAQWNTSTVDAQTAEEQEMRVHTSSLPCLPGHSVVHYLGIINLFLIRESTSVGERSRANSFMHLFILEAESVARAHVRALGGNALLSYRLSEVVFVEHPQKSQAQCLLNLSGDVALVEPTQQDSSVTQSLFTT